MHCSKSENSKGERIDFLINCSILPLEIWPKRQCHNFEDTSCTLFRLFIAFIDEETFSFSVLTAFTFSESDNNKVCLVGRQDQHTYYYTQSDICKYQNGNHNHHQVVRHLSSLYTKRVHQEYLKAEV